MQGRKFSGVKPGQPIRAAMVNQTLDEVQRQGKVSFGGGVSGTSGPNGTIFSVDGPDWLFIKITAINGSNQATWTEQVRSGGAWVDGPRSGSPSSDPAYEVNGSSPSLPRIVVAKRAPESGELIYQSGPC